MSTQTKDTLSRIEMLLEELLSKMDTLISLTRLSQRQTAQLTMKGLSNLEQDIYSLCDGTRTVSEISKTLGKSIQVISIYLSKLEEKGLVTYRKKGKQKYYEGIL
jgi:DNA-binding transcriptional ArsR family regulator